MRGIFPPRSQANFKGENKMSFKKFISVASALCASLFVLSFAACSGDNGGEETNAPCTHTVAVVAPKDADCANEGCFAHYACTKCGETFSDSKGEKPISKDKIVIKKLPHKTQVQNESVGDYSKFYYCTGCGHYFADGSGKTEIPYEELVDSSVTPVKMNDLAKDGIILATKSYNPQSEFEDIKGDFTCRMFAGWRSSDGKGISEFTSPQNIQLNFNLNRSETLSQSVPGDIWYNFGIVYNANTGFAYKRLQAGVVSAKEEFKNLFVENGGMYIRVVRKGTMVSFYFEDKFGMPRLIDSNNDFGGSGTLVRFAANSAASADGWNPFVEKAEICLGIANPRCVFSK